MRRLIIYFVVASCFSACKTTGNPNSGGLWRWSEEEAISRQKEMEQQVNQLSIENKNIELQNQQLKYKNTKLQDEEQGLKYQLNGLIAERKQLLEQIEKIKINKAQKSRRLNQLKIQDRLGQKENKKLSQQFNHLNDVNKKKMFLQGIGAQNQRLTEEIILLLEGI